MPAPPAREDRDAPEPLRLDGPHRFVRHPLYTALFLVLWGRAFDEAMIATAVWGSLYLIVGTRFEERKLLRLHGAAYARYRARVPAFLPWKGRAWTE
jgi:protein-S-isoprenylcysteine O-methyltransferase Ste14